ncbi:Rrf2 family transcriptional regulator [Natronorubrum thiooxidans]|uniref:Transcriptional regulator, BadM/Rrf2 family n=1 Tax=Natronorubrum thiooxidans TaxID=308853 RepID=A0A1N7H053_9EURY|nr:Rrf2 family transcriptional regulator [Natronorubrum thiooxidans]SIS18140.1 transcriptional regulator, BadM/Rrf2 family [Natronorubrum thiooxidans]
MNGSSRLVVATHVLTVLAVVSDQRLSSEKLAWSLNTNPVVVRRLLGHLRDADLVISKRGPNGGFALARSPDDVSLYDIYEALEVDSLFTFHPNEPNEACPVGDNIQAILTETLKPAEKALTDELKTITIDDLSQQILERSATPIESVESADLGD